MTATPGPSWRLSLPVFGFMFLSIVGSGIFALPIALAPLGPVLAATCVLVAGAINILTITVLATSLARSPASMGARGRLGTLAAQRLGGRIGLLAALISGLLIFSLEIVSVLGLAGSLGGVTGTSALAWTVGLVAVITVVVTVGRRGGVFAISTIVAIITVAILALLGLLLAPHVSGEFLSTGHVTGPGWREELAVVLGTLVYAYFGHASVPSVAPDSLRADPTGRSLLRGCVAAMVAATIVNTGWTLVTLGSVPRELYAAQTSVGIEAIASVIGPLGQWLALAVVVLSLGVGSLIYAFILTDLVRERMPTTRTYTTALVPGTVLEAFEHAPLGLVLTISVAPDGSVVARAQKGHATASVRVPLSAGALTTWQARELIAEVDETSRRWLTVTFRRESDGTLVANAQSTYALQERRFHVSSASVLLHDDPEYAHVLAVLTRHPGDVPSLAVEAGCSAEEMLDRLTTLQEQGMATEQQDGTWRVVLGRRHAARSAHLATLADALADETDAVEEPSTGFASAPWAATAAAPATQLVVFACLIALIATGISFTKAVSVVGIVADIFLGVTMPVLLLAATNGNRDSLGPVSRLIPPRPLAWTTLTGVLLLLAIYAIWIYQDFGSRAVAVAALALSGASVILAMQRRSFTPSTTATLVLADRLPPVLRIFTGPREVSVPQSTKIPTPGDHLTTEVPGPLHGPLRVLLDTPDGGSGPISRIRMQWPGGSFSCAAPVSSAGIIAPTPDPSESLTLEFDAG